MTLSYTAVIIISIIQVIGFQLGLWTIFKKAGLKGWLSIIPVYRTWLRKVIDRPWWWMIFWVMPFIGVFMVYYMIWETIRCFNKRSYLYLIPGTFFFFFYLPYLGLSKKETYTPRAELPEYKKSWAGAMPSSSQWRRPSSCVRLSSNFTPSPPPLWREP